MELTQTVMPLSTAEEDIMQLVTSLSHATPGACEIRSSMKDNDKLCVSGPTPLSQTAAGRERTSPLTPESNCSSVVSERSMSEEVMTPPVSSGNFPSRKNVPVPESLPKDIKLPQRKGGMQLWQFLYAVLQEGHTEIIKYTDDESELEFRIVEPDTIAAWWGYQKNHKNMNFDKFSRSLRYYYERKLIQRVYGEKFVYRFCCHPEYLYDVLDSSDCRPKLKPLPTATKTSLSLKGKSPNPDLPDWEDIKSSSASSQSSPHSLHQAYSPLSVSPKAHSPVPPTCHHQLIAPGQDTLSPYWTAFTTGQYVNSHCSNSMWTNTPSVPYLAVPSTHHTVDYYGSGIAPMSGYPQVQVNQEHSLTVPNTLPYSSVQYNSCYPPPKPSTTRGVSTASSPAHKMTSTSAFGGYRDELNCDSSLVVPSTIAYTSAPGTSYYPPPPLSTTGSVSTVSSPANEVADMSVFSPYQKPSPRPPVTMATTVTSSTYPSNDFFF